MSQVRIDLPKIWGYTKVGARTAAMIVAGLIIAFCMFIIAISFANAMRELVAIIGGAK